MSKLATTEPCLDPLTPCAVADSEQLSAFPEVLAKHRLPTNSTSNGHPVQRWANFVAGFSVEFVLQSLQALEPRGRVLDPFMGTGTTIVAARLMGLDSIGYEAHPLFAVLAMAKASSFTPSDVAAVEHHLLRPGRPNELSESAARFLQKLFNDEALKSLLVASRNLRQLPERLTPLAVAMLLQAAERCCGSKTDGIYKAPTTRKKRLPFNVAWSATRGIFEADIASSWYRSWTQSARSEVVHGSATSLDAVDDESVAAVVTSPPYLNNFDFAEMTRMQLYLLGWAGSWGEITRTVRSQLITNTTTALKGKRDEEYQAACRRVLPTDLAAKLEPIVRALADERGRRKGKKEYDFLVYPYYRQILDVLLELRRVLRPQARVHWIVSDAALYGVYIAAHEHTASLMRAAGFDSVEITTLRARGHRWKLDKRDGAPGRLGEYHLRATA